MARGRFNRLLDCIHRLASGRADSALTDRHLLEGFAQKRDEDAFAVLVRRHGSLVLSVCRRVLGHEQGAEDAFQAVFLVLARKADAVRWRDDISNWLYGVACRVARKARAQTLRREAHSGPLHDVVAPTAEEAGWEELRPLLDEEINRLPEKYRAPVVLCYLKGKSYGEAAQLLSWAEGTVSGRLARARALLRNRLLRRGLAPSAALLAALPAGSAEAALPAVLTAVVGQTASAFALERGIGEGVISGPAVALANEVLRSMLLTKWKIGVVVLLALAATGTMAAVFAQRQRPEKQPEAAPVPAKAPAIPKVEANARPPLKKEWQGRWDANPFAGTTSIEIVHNGVGHARTYQIEDPSTVAALMKQLTITAFRNDIARGNKPSALLTFHKKDKTSYKVWIASDGAFQYRGGEIYVAPAFLAALGRQLADAGGRPIDLTERLPGPPAKKPEPAIPPSLDAFKAGFKSLRVQYFRGKQLRWAYLTDRENLDELEKALDVVKFEAAKGRKGMKLPSQQFTAEPKGTGNRSWLNGYLLDRERIFIWDVGWLTAKPSFVETLNKQLSRLEGREVDVLGENNPPEEQIKRERALREMLSDVRALRYTGKDGREIVVDQREDVAKLLKPIQGIEAPARQRELETTGEVVEVTTAKGEKVRLTYLRVGDDGAKVGVVPHLMDLVEVTGLGQMWLSKSWPTHFSDYGYQREMEAKERRSLETSRLVSRDLPAFLKQVVNLVVHYREGESELSACLTAEKSRLVLEAMEVEKVEELSWTRQRWQAEMEKLQQRGASMMELTPGIGFNLPVVFAGDKELLILLYGRVYLKAGIAEKLRQALQDDPDKAKELQLLPHRPE